MHMLLRRLALVLLLVSLALSAYPEGSPPPLTGPRLTLDLSGTKSYVGTAAVRGGFVATAFPGDMILRTPARLLISTSNGMGHVLAITDSQIASEAPITAPSFTGTINGITPAALAAAVGATTLATSTNNPDTIVKRDDSGGVTVGRVQFGDGSVQTTASRPRRSAEQIATLQWHTANEAILDHRFTNIQPFAMAWDGQRMWISANGGVIALDRDMQTVRTVTINDILIGIAFDGNVIWAAGYTTNQVFVMLPTGSAAFPIPTGGTGPQFLAFDGMLMWVTLGGSNTVAKMSALTSSVIATYPVAGQPTGIAFDGSSMWVASTTANTVTKLRASDGANLGSFATGARPYAVAFDGTNVWVTNSGANTVSRFRASDGAANGTFTVGANPHGIAFDGENMWVIGVDRSVTILRATDGALVRTTQIGQTDARYIAFDGLRMWITVPGANTISRR
jgi:hypothetical protein